MIHSECVFSEQAQSGRWKCELCGEWTRRPYEKPPTRACGITQNRHVRVGHKLAKIIKAFGLKKTDGCQCDEMIGRMNRLGIDGCRRHRSEIVDHLRKAYKKTSTPELIAASARAFKHGIAFKLDLLDPLGSLVDLAIERAEQQRVRQPAPRTSTRTDRQGAD